MLFRKKKIAVFISLIYMQIAAFGQLTLNECFKRARENYPLIKQFDLIEKSKAFNRAASNQNWLPQVSISGKANWQSDVTTLPDKFLTILETMGVTNVSFPNKDQYNLAINLSQTIWDGGITAAQKEMTTINAEINKEQTEVNLYAIYLQVNQLYFTVLSLNEQLKQNQLFIDELQRNYKMIESYVKNGIAQRSDLDNVKVSMLEAEQQKIEMKAYQKAGMAVLSAFIGQTIDTAIELVRPPLVEVQTGIENRPELKLFSAQNQLFEIQSKMLYTKGMPRISLFATAAIGNPGLNMFKSGFTPYFIGGVNLLWNFSGLYSMDNDKKNLLNLQKMTAIQREVFFFSITQKMTQQNTDIQKLNDLIKQDDEIIELRMRIKNTSAVKVENGTLTISDYLRDVTHENMARQIKTLHEISLLQTISQLKIESGQMKISD